MKKAPLLLLALLATTQLHAQEKQRYQCDNGSRVELSLSTDAEQRPQATLHFADSEITLPRVPSASGERYRRDQLDLTLSKQSLNITDGHDNRRQCQRLQALTGSFVELHGQVSYTSRQPLAANSELLITIERLPAQGGKALTLSSQRYRLADATGPLAFNATLDRDLLPTGQILRITARLQSKRYTRQLGESQQTLDGYALPLININLKPLAAKQR